MHKLLNVVKMIFNIEGGTLKFQVDKGVPELASLTISEIAGVFVGLSIAALSVVDKLEDVFIPEDEILNILLVSKSSN